MLGATVAGDDEDEEHEDDNIRLDDAMVVVVEVLGDETATKEFVDGDDTAITGSTTSGTEEEGEVESIRFDSIDICKEKV